MENGPYKRKSSPRFVSINSLSLLKWNLRALWTQSAVVTPSSNFNLVLMVLPIYYTWICVCAFLQNWKRKEKLRILQMWFYKTYCAAILLIKVMMKCTKASLILLLDMTKMLSVFITKWLKLCVCWISFYYDATKQNGAQLMICHQYVYNPLFFFFSSAHFALCIAPLPFAASI